MMMCKARWRLDSEKNWHWLGKLETQLVSFPPKINHQRGGFWGEILRKSLGKGFLSLHY